MTGVTIRNTLPKNLKDMVPWLSKNALQEVLERRRREKLEVVEEIVEKEREMLSALPEDVRALIKIPDPEELVGE